MGNTNYKPGQILCIKSSMGPWYYYSVLHYAKPVENMDNTYELHTCCDLCITPNDTDCLTVARDNGSFLDIDTAFEKVREAYGAERVHLYNALVKAFKNHDLCWDKHFTDSTYDDIQDWLYNEFNINIDAMADNIIAGNNNPLVDTIYEITNYIWEALCKETNNYQEETTEPEMVNKQEFIVKAGEIYKKHLIKFNPMLKEFPTALDEAVNAFRKQMEE